MAVRKSAKKGRRGRRDRNIAVVAMLCVTTLIVAFLMTRKQSVVVEAKEKAPTVVAEFDTVSLPVPAHFVPAGTPVSKIRFKYMSYPKHQVPKGALFSVEKYYNGVTVAPLPANLPVFRENLSLEAKALNPVVERIPKGMRAMTVKVDATAAVEGWAGSGSIVDVLLVEKDKTTVIAEGVKILSAERSVDPVNPSSAPSVPKTVTLLVTQEQCLAINTAIPLGKIAFALRGATDGDNWRETVFTSERLRGRNVATPHKVSEVRGVITVKGDRGAKYALTDGKWIKTETVPDGFLVGEKGSK
ncbi:MAG: Flp pilus assembly protein CpaB [Candidatus Dadabacteria bacterium]|nr:MAG: Flp pilus assembly protein CpaB [Candidatus Dadabacteria bacterium]